MFFFSSLIKKNPDEKMGEKEYRRVFDAHFEDLRRFLYYKSKNKELSEDIAQDAFVKLWEIRDEVRLKTVKTFLFTIGNNLLHNTFKKDQHHLQFIHQKEDRIEVESPEYILEHKQFKEKLEHVIDSLPEASRVVFLMSRMDGKKYSEIAELLDIGVKAVEKRMSIALKILRSEISDKL